MKVHTFTDYGRSVVVSGCTDSSIAEAAVVAEIVDAEWFLDRVWDAFPDATQERLRELVEIEARKWIADNPPRLTVGRMVPDWSGEYSWLWMENLHPDRPGAFFALVYDEPRMTRTTSPNIDPDRSTDG